jgi:glycine dehydrogenase subunit 1
LSAHPYMANSAPELKAELLAATGIDDVEELFAQIPADHRTQRPLELPPALISEVSLRRHLEETLARGSSCTENLSFLGAGCWQHYVPALCDEIVGRTEFLTPVWGTPSSDLGRNQAWFEWASQMGELLELDFVALPVYSYGCAAGHAIRMAARMTGRDEVLVPRTLDPERRAVIRTYCEPSEMPRHIRMTDVGVKPETGRLDVADLKAKLSDHVAAVYIENPSYLGIIEPAGAEIARLAHDAGAEMIVGVDPLSLGVLRPPSQYGADIVVGTMQPLGVHMNCGGGAGGFIASRDEARYASEYPTLQLSICNTTVPGERGFGMILFEQTSYGSREQGKDWTGNSVYLWAIANAVYLSLIGPQGIVEIGQTILQRGRYAARRLGELPGVSITYGEGFFKEFVVNFDGCSQSVAEINAALRERGIFGGKDLSEEFPEHGQSALYCVTEVHEKSDIDRLAQALTEVLA